MVWAPLFGVFGLLFAGATYRCVTHQPAGTARMREIADSIHEGSMAFLEREYIALAVFIAVVGGLLAYAVGVTTALAFVGGAACSICAGFLGYCRFAC